MRIQNLPKFLMAATLLVSCGGAGAANKPAPALPATDADLANSVRHEIAMYPYYTIWDDITIRADNGNVELTGVVSQPHKKQDIDKIVRNLAGGTNVNNQIRVLPLSHEDDRLRMRVARAIFGDPAMARYVIQPVSPIHVIVENGHVTLTGIVATNLDKEIAGLRASAAGLSLGPVVNNLQVENPPSKKS